MAAIFFLLVVTALSQAHRTVAPSLKKGGSKNFHGGNWDMDSSDSDNLDVRVKNYDIDDIGMAGFIKGPVDRGTYNYHYGSTTDEEADPEYAEAKRLYEEAEDYATKMSLKCSEPAIQRNYRVRDDCYAERSRAYAARDAAKDRFYAIRDGVWDGAPSTRASKKPAKKKSISKPAKRVKPLSKKPTMSNQPSDSEKKWHPTIAGLWETQTPNIYTNGKSIFDQYGTCIVNNENANFVGEGNGGYYTNGFDASTTNFRPARPAAKPGLPVQHHNLHGFNDDDDSEARSSPEDDTPAGTGLQITPSGGFGSSFNNKGGGKQMFTGAVINSKPSSGTESTNNYDNGDTYKLYQEIKFVDGVCMEHWEIGLASIDKMWEPSFDVPCNAENVRGYFNRPDKVIVSNPDDSFCLFSNTLDSMTVIRDGTCTKYKYTQMGVKKSEDKLNDRNCEKEKKLMWDLLKAGTGSLKTPSGGIAHVTGQSIDIGAHAGDGKSFKMHNFHVSDDASFGSVTNNGPYYSVKITNMKSGATCNDKIKIYQKTENGLTDEFTVPCASSNRNCEVEGKEALVGGPDNKFCAFTMEKMPKTTVIIQDGKCKKRTYTDPADSDSDSIVFEATLKDKDCQFVKDIIKKIEAKLLLRLDTSPKGKERITSEIEFLEDALAKRLRELTPASTTSFTRPATKTGLQTIIMTIPKGGTTTVTGVQNNFGDIKGNGVGSIHFTPQGAKLLPQGFGGPAVDLDFGRKNPLPTSISSAEPSRSTNEDNFFTVDLRDIDSLGECKEEVSIEGSRLKGSFTTKCLESGERFVHYGDEALVGDPDEPFCAFSNSHLPYVLMLIRNGKCSRLTYTEEATINVDIAKTSCDLIKSDIKYVKELLTNRDLAVENGEETEVTKIDKQIDDAEKRVNSKIKNAILMKKLLR